MSKSKLIAEEIAQTCDILGWEYFVREDLFTIAKPIPRHDLDAFRKADGEYYQILSRLPQTRLGSWWGTDGGGVGARQAVTNGRFVMTMSGGSKRVLKALEELQ